MKKVQWIVVMAGVVSMMKLTCAAGETTQAQSCSEAATAEGILGLANPSNSPVDVVVAAESASLRDGIRLKVTFKNISDKPYPLSICTNMLLCCVAGLHPIVAFDGTGMGLLDLCKDTTGPAPAMNISVAPKADHTIDVTIPSQRLPANACIADKALLVFFCFELGDGKPFHSNVVKVTLTE